ncbi:MAG TPA: molybdate ABC transporter permease subunit [Chitinophagaceae bacterium]|nr:molybdate ABC transporter permease subunit [Chitinophagaceae bacterium]
MIDPGPLWLTLKLALVTTLILLGLGIPLASWLAYRRTRWKAVAEVFVSMPLVLPPSVIGFYLLLAFSPTTGLGRFLENSLGLRLAFSFPGLVIASVLYSLPFMVHPLQSGFASLPPQLREASYVLGKTRWQTLWRVLLPNMKPALLSGTVLSFAHTIGEFGVVLMIGGNIPGQTRVASIAIFDEVESMNYHSANLYALILFAVSFLILLVTYLVNHRITLLRQP